MECNGEIGVAQIYIYIYGYYNGRDENNLSTSPQFFFWLHLSFMDSFPTRVETKNKIKKK